MAILQKAFKEGAKASGKAGNLFSKIVNAEKNAIAANNADDIKKAKKTLAEAEKGNIEGTGLLSSIEDVVGDVTNMATFGASRKLTNVFSKDKIDYKTYKEKTKNTENRLTLDERAAMLAGLGPSESDTEKSDDDEFGKD